MTARVDLIWLSDDRPAPEWALGDALTAAPSPQAIHALVEMRLPASRADAWLFWDAGLGSPDPVAIKDTLTLPGDVWHAGLRLGMGGLPGLMDFVSPTWMLTRDPDPGITATSWRLSLRACLVRTNVLRQLGGPRADFQTLAGAALEFGHRAIRLGATVRHVPDLVTSNALAGTLPLADEARFICARYGRRWARYALWRAVMAGYATPGDALRAARVLRGPRTDDLPPYHRVETGEPVAGDVSVIIPTLDRYDYLRGALAGLRVQTHPPLEVIVVDQTPLPRRDDHLVEAFADLPLRVLHQDEAGQCSSRNTGLQAARGAFVLFVDDDDDIPPDLIEKHLRHLADCRADASCGVALEAGAGDLPPDFTSPRISDVFPTNNTLLRRDALRDSGLFNLAFERGPRADADLGMRLYLGGALLRLSPDVKVVHRHAPRGGLRAHNARVVTYASSRASLTQRHLPAATEIYLALRYFSARQVREMLWLRALGTLAYRGNAAGRALKIAIGLLLMPGTLVRIWRRTRTARRMLDAGPDIPVLED